MKPTLIILALIAGSIANAESPAMPERAPAAAAADTTAKPTVRHDGNVFELARSSAATNVETDEYVLAGEQIADWTQLVTVQRLAFTGKAGVDEFVTYFEKRVAEDGASLEVLKRAPGACVFVVRFPKSDRNDEQVMICLAFADPSAPSRLNIVQYAVKPLRVPVGTIEARIRSWRDKFFRQAAAKE